VPRLLRDWTALTMALCEGASHRLTVTVGLGAGVFGDRYGWRNRRPVGLEGGDLALQVCADDRQVVFDAVHRLAGAALGIARRRWTQHGWAAPRNVAGFQDGTADPAEDELARHVWVRDRRGMVDGTYLVFRRIRMRLTAWDRNADQERVIGRRKGSGALLEPAPVGSHVRAMRPDSNGGVRILRRSYNYDDGATADGDADAGLAFIAFTADPIHGCGRLLRRFERDDELHDYAITTAGAVFAIPPAPGPGEYVGERLLA
jgi:deferrochelatase/peroxidase EfeB